VLFVGD